MKTEKQIALLAKESGENYIKESADMDEIVAEEESLTKWQEKLLSTMDFFNMAPPLKEGVFTYKTNRYTGKLIFECEITENGDADLSLTSLYTQDHILWLWEFDANIRVENICNTKTLTDSYVTDYNDPVTVIMAKQKKPQAKFEEYTKNTALENMQGPIQTFLLTNAWINYLMEHPEEKEIKRSERKTTKRPDGTKKQSDGTKATPAAKRVINLNQITIRTSDTKTERNLKSRKKATFSWSVRGHLRHYKSGKTIYIKPYEKGTGNKRKKIYTTKNT